MAPIHESDIEENRFKSNEWNHYELWEKVEVRLKRRKWLWISFVVVVFIALSAIPIFSDRKIKWVEVGGLRRLSETLGEMKVRVGHEKKTERLTFVDGGVPQYVIERVESCDQPGGEVIQSGSLNLSGRETEIQVLTEQDATRFGIPGVSNRICYDPIQGMRYESNNREVKALALIPRVDYESTRTDRIAILLFAGPNGEMSFE